MHRFILFLTFIFLSIPASAQDITTSAKQAYIIDYETGSVLFQKNANEQMPTSSMSKVMSMLAVFQALEDGRLSLGDELLVSEKAWKKGGSKMFVQVDSKVKVEDLIRGVIVQSGNDATIVLAEALSGSEDGFAREITRMAKQIGMSNSNFTNASGWPDPNHYSTAHDLGIMAQYLIKKYPEYYNYYSELEFEYNEITQGNRNPLLYKDIGADGVKTGHTEAGGYGLIGSGVRDGRRVILVLNGMASVQERADESARLLEWALRNFKNQKLFEAGKIVAHADVVLGTKETLALQAGEDVYVTVPLSSMSNIKAEARFDSPVIAPVTEGTRIGTMVVTIPSYGEAIEVPLLAAENVEEPDLFKKTLEKIKLFIKQNL